MKAIKPMHTCFSEKLRVGNVVLPIDLILNKRENFVNIYLTFEFPQLHGVFLYKQQIDKNEEQGQTFHDLAEHFL